MSAKPVPEFTIEELLSQLSREEAPDGYTVKEICEKRGLPSIESNKRKIRKIIGDWIALGKWEFVGFKKVHYPSLKSERDVPCYGPIKISKGK